MWWRRDTPRFDKRTSLGIRYVGRSRTHYTESCSRVDLDVRQTSYHSQGLHVHPQPSLCSSCRHHGRRCHTPCPALSLCTSWYQNHLHRPCLHARYPVFHPHGTQLQIMRTDSSTLGYHWRTLTSDSLTRRTCCCCQQWRTPWTWRARSTCTC